MYGYNLQCESMNDKLIENTRENITIILTGAGGFIGSVMLGYLNKQGISDVVLFDDLQNETQYRNLVGKKFKSIHPHSTFEKTTFNPKDINAVIHIGANSSTLERNWPSIYKSNVLSTRMWNAFCLEHAIPFIFTSSAAVYGNGAGPLNQYAFSKTTKRSIVFRAE